MPAIPIHVADTPARDGLLENIPLYPLPQLLQTPSGLAILELQGTINLPVRGENKTRDQDLEASQTTSTTETQIGRIIFPDYDPSAELSDKGWMKRVYLTVGQHQRLTGEVKRIPKPLAVIRRRNPASWDANGTASENTKAENYRKTNPTDQLEIIEIIRFKIIFSSRPEPITNEEY